MAARDLVGLIQELEEVVLAGSGVDSFWEILKLIYAKLYSEQYSLQTEGKAQLINHHFSLAKKKWPGVFKDNETINLSPAQLTICLPILEKVQLLDTKLEVLDAAFEYLLPAVAKGNRGQYFTPRHVIRAVVKMLNPKTDELILDPACGSGGFLLETIEWTRKNKALKNNVFGIDFDEKAFAVAKMMMLVAGYNDKNIYKLNSLEIKSNDIQQFDLVLTNPPFGGEIRDPQLLKEYELARDAKGKLRGVVERHILFLERIITLLKPGGRAGLVMPQGILNNRNLAYIREWLFNQARILGVIGLSNTTFKPHTSVKTSLLIIQKWKDKPLTDYPIFMAVSQNGGKDKSGNLIYQNGKPYHDLNQIAESFIEFSRKEKLNF